MPSTSSRPPFRKQTCVVATSAVRSSIASAKRSSGIVPSASAGTWTTRRPRRSCACQIWPIVGNSKLLTTTVSRPSSKRRPLARALTPAETDLVLVRVHERRDGAPHSLETPDPVLPRRAVLVPVVQVLPVGVAHRVRERALRAAVDVDPLLEHREAVPDAPRQRRDVNGQGKPFEDPRARAVRRLCPRARCDPSGAHTRGRRSTRTRWRSARRRGSRPRTRAPAG